MIIYPQKYFILQLMGEFYHYLIIIKINDKCNKLLNDNIYDKNKLSNIFM